MFSNTSLELNTSEDKEKKIEQLEKEYQNTMRRQTEMIRRNELRNKNTSSIVSIPEKVKKRRNRKKLSTSASSSILPNHNQPYGSNIEEKKLQLPFAEVISSQPIQPLGNGNSITQLPEVKTINTNTNTTANINNTTNLLPSTLTQNLTKITQPLYLETDQTNQMGQNGQNIQTVGQRSNSSSSNNRNNYSAISISDTIDNKNIGNTPTKSSQQHIKPATQCLSRLNNTTNNRVHNISQSSTFNEIKSTRPPYLQYRNDINQNPRREQLKNMHNINSSHQINEEQKTKKENKKDKKISHVLPQVSSADITMNQTTEPTMHTINSSNNVNIGSVLPAPLLQPTPAAQPTRSIRPIIPRSSLPISPLIVPTIAPIISVDSTSPIPTPVPVNDPLNLSTPALTPNPNPNPNSSSLVTSSNNMFNGLVRTIGELFSEPNESKFSVSYFMDESTSNDEDDNESISSEEENDEESDEDFNANTLNENNSRNPQRLLTSLGSSSSSSSSSSISYHVAAPTSFSSSLFTPFGNINNTNNTNNTGNTNNRNNNSSNISSSSNWFFNINDNDNDNIDSDSDNDGDIIFGASFQTPSHSLHPMNPFGLLSAIMGPVFSGNTPSFMNLSHVINNNNNNNSTNSNNHGHLGPLPQVPASEENEPKLPEGDKTTHRCAICMERAVATVILECMHSVMCVTCARTLVLGESNNMNQGPKCPMCRKKIDRIIKPFTA